MQDLFDKQRDIILPKAGKTIKGTIIDVSESRILLELADGMMGLISKKELSTHLKDALVEGGEIESVVINPENEQGLVMLSLKKASQDMIWADLNTMSEEERIIKVKITDANKGGLMADYKGLRCFLPVSQLTPLNYPRVDGAEAGQILKKLQTHLGKEFAVRVINVDRENEKIIISEKAAHSQKARETLAELKVGEVLNGTVSGVLKYGIFVTFGGVEGLVHLSELDWGHVSNPGKHYKIGDKTDIMVIGIDGDKLSLSIKRLTEDEWKEKVSGYKADDQVSGKVLRWNSQGVFIEISNDIQGLFALEDFGVEKHADLSLKEGDVVKGAIKEINYDSHRLELKKVD